MRVAIVGATGQVGTVMRAILLERNFPGRGDSLLRVVALGRHRRSSGRVEPIEVEDAATADFSGIDIALDVLGRAPRPRS